MASPMAAFLANEPPAARVPVEWRYADPPGAEWRPIYAAPPASVRALVASAALSYGAGRPTLFRAGGAVWFSSRGRPIELPVPRWGYSSESLAWAAARSWPEAWESCPEPLWMLHAAARFVPAGRLAAAVVALLEPALPLMPPEEALLSVSALVARVGRWAGGFEGAPDAESVGAVRSAAEALARRGDPRGSAVAAAAHRVATIPLAADDPEGVDPSLAAAATAAARDLSALPGWDPVAMAGRVRAAVPLSSILLGVTGM